MRPTKRLAVALLASVMTLAYLVLPGSAAAAQGQRLDLKLLVIGAAVGDPTTDAWTSELTRQGIPYDVVRPSTGQALPPLVNPVDPKHGYYNGVVLATHASLLGDLSKVYTYERDFGVRQISGFEFPNATVGMEFTGTVVVGPFTAELTNAGKGAFNYLAGPVPLDRGTRGYDSYYDASPPPPSDEPAPSPFTPKAWTGEPISGVTNFTPYLLAPTDAPTEDNKPVTGRVIGGFYTHTGKEAADPNAALKKGVQEVVLTFNYNSTMTQWRLLAPGLIRWVTRGVHLGYNRNYLNNQVDDIFSETDAWSTEWQCTPGATAPRDPLCGPTAPTTGPILRMNATDVTKVLEWQKANNFKLDMAFNAVMAAPGDPLTAALLKNKAAFRWVNHTWTHAFLSCRAYNTPDDPTSGCADWPSTEEIRDEIVRNINYSAARNLPGFNEATLITGEHSGLDNPNLPEAMKGITATGPTGETWTVDITSIAADNSRQPNQYVIGTARTIPRHPSNVYYNVSTRDTLVSEYNTLYVKPENGGKCVAVPDVTTCRETPATYEEIMSNEAATMLRNMISNDPRPGYSHQSNLAGDQLILDLLGRVIRTYRSYFSSNAPIVTPRQVDAGVELQRQDSWRAAVAAKRVTAYIRDGVVTVTTTANQRVPLTLPGGSTVGTTTTAFGQSYAGSLSAWVQIQRGSVYTYKAAA